MSHEGALTKRQSFSFALATAIVVAQAIGLYTLVGFRAFEKRQDALEAPLVTWFDFKSRDTSSQDRTPSRDVLLPPLPRSRPLSLPSFDPAISPSTLEQTSDALRGALRDLECTALYGDKTAPSDPEWCKGERQKLTKTLPSIDDGVRAQKFARAKAVQESPVTVPCVGGGGLSLPCLIGGAISGFNFEMGTYANDPAAGARSPPQRGATGIPDISGGLH